MGSASWKQVRRPLRSPSPRRIRRLPPLNQLNQLGCPPHHQPSSTRRHSPSPNQLHSSNKCRQPSFVQLVAPVTRTPSSAKSAAAHSLSECGPTLTRNTSFKATLAVEETNDDELIFIKSINMGGANIRLQEGSRHNLSCCSAALHFHSLSPSVVEHLPMPSLHVHKLVNVNSGKPNASAPSPLCA